MFSYTTFEWNKLLTVSSLICAIAYQTTRYKIENNLKSKFGARVKWMHWMNELNKYYIVFLEKLKLIFVFSMFIFTVKSRQCKKYKLLTKNALKQHA